MSILAQQLNIALILTFLLHVNGKFYMKNATVVDSKEKIVGGEKVDIKKFSHLVSFSMFGVHLCDGSIITPSHILTAAHCVDIFKTNPTHLKVRSGSSTKNSGGEVSEVSKIIVHENFDYSNTGSDDIAILVLSEPLKFDINTQEIPLIKRRLKTGEDVHIAGWGLNSTDSNNETEILKALHLQIAEQSLCKQFYSSRHGRCVVTQNTEGACFGDSGGSLTVDGYLAGIASAIAFSKCGVPGEPMLFMPVGPFRKWIRQKIQIDDLKMHGDHEKIVY